MNYVFQTKLLSDSKILLKESAVREQRLMAEKDQLLKKVCVSLYACKNDKLFLYFVEEWIKTCNLFKVFISPM